MIKVSKRKLLWIFKEAHTFIQIAATDRGDCCVHIRDTNNPVPMPIYSYLNRIQFARTLLQPRVAVHLEFALKLATSNVTNARTILHFQRE